MVAAGRNAGDAAADARGYMTAVPYPPSYVGEQAPHRLCYVAALNGFTPPRLERPFSYCDLGCGSAYTLCLLAACFPHGRFVGVDVNPEHIEAGRALARDARLDNVRLIASGFSDPPALAEDPFDIVTAHGVLSWVAPRVRVQLADFLDLKLNPGGLLYLGYNAMPGWAPLMPLRHMLLRHAETVAGGVDEKVRAALAHVDALLDGNARYFVENPKAAKLYRDLRGRPPGYLAHEFLNANWRPLFFDDVARDFAGAGLIYAGEVEVAHNYPAYSLHSNFRGLAEACVDRIALERMKDMTIDRMFRRDVFVRSAAPADDGVVQRLMARGVFGSLKWPARLSPRMRLPMGELALEGEEIKRILELFKLASVDLATLRDDPALAAMTGAELVAAVQTLIAGGHALPFTAASAYGGASPTGRYALPLAFNRAALGLIGDIGGGGGLTLALAAPAAGAGRVLDALDATVLEAVVAHGLDMAPHYAVRTMKARGQTLAVKEREGAAVKGSARGDDDDAALMTRYVREFSRDKLPKLIALGVVEPLDG